MAKGLFPISLPFKILTLAIHAGWLLIIVASAAINHYHAQQEMEQTARTEAATIFERDATFRQWFSEYGGAYVKVTPQTPPSPYLAHIPHRDISMPDGTQLTLINPAYLMRLVNESNLRTGAPSTRMTSQNPLRPENGPDPWEKQALERAAQGEEDIFEFTTINGEPYLRYLHAAPTKKHCLKCHAHQGYKLGDLRGGLAVALPIGKLLASHEKTIHRLYAWHLLIYLSGAALLLWGQGLVGRRVRERDLAVAALEESERKFRTVADFAHAWEYWLAPDGAMVYVSPSVERVTGYPAHRFLSDPEFLNTILVGAAGRSLSCHLKSDRQPEEDQADIQIRTAAGEVRWLHHVCRPVFDGDGVYLGRRASNYDITEEKLVKLQKEELIDKLREALENVKTLSGFLPICASCKKIRDDRGYWNQIEAYLAQHSAAIFSHGICPDCARELYPKFYRNGSPEAAGRKHQSAGEANPGADNPGEANPGEANPGEAPKSPGPKPKE